MYVTLSCLKAVGEMLKLSQTLRNAPNPTHPHLRTRYYLTFLPCHWNLLGYHQVVHQLLRLELIQQSFWSQPAHCCVFREGLR